MLTTSLILDIVTAALILLCVYCGFKRGFIKSTVRLIGCLAAVVAAAILAPLVADAVYEHVFKATLVSLVDEQISAELVSSAASLQAQLDSVLGGLPEIIRSALSMYGIDGAQDISGVAGQDAVATEQLTTVVMDQIVSPVCVMLLRVIAFLILFILLFFAVKGLGGLLDKIFASLPLIKQVNGLLGGAIGLAEGVLIVFILCLGLRMYMTFAGADSVVTMTDIDDAKLLGWLMEHNPIM